MKMNDNNSNTQYYKDYEMANKEYDKYLEEHITNVTNTWFSILKPILEDKSLNLLPDNEDIDMIGSQIIYHDDSKYTDIEYVPYRNNFYPTCEEDLDADNQKAYDLAWLHHIHNNPHHWQYWVLIQDDTDIKVLDMTFSSICEMLCDWHSFSAKDPISTAKHWYDTNKQNMILSKNTINTIELLIDYLAEPLKN